MVLNNKKKLSILVTGLYLDLILNNQKGKNLDWIPKNQAFR